MVFNNNVILQTSTSVKQTLTVAVLMPFVTTPTDPSIAHVNLDIKEMEKNCTGNIHFSVCSARMASNALCVFQCFLFDLFSFVSLTTYFVCSNKRTSVGFPLSRQLIGIHRANLVYCHWCSISFQTSTSVKKERTIAVLTRFVITPKDPTTAHVNQDMKETKIIAEVISFVNSSFLQIIESIAVFVFLWSDALYSNFLPDSGPYNFKIQSGKFITLLGNCI